MTQSFCTECGSQFSGQEKFCTSCGQGLAASEPTVTGKDEFGPTSLPMPDGLPSIRLESYRGSDRSEAIALINRLSAAQREVWVRAGQPDILLWPGGDFATWLGALAPDFYNAAKSAEASQVGVYPQAGVFVPPPSNGLATAGFVLSLVSLVTFYLMILGILGLIFGIRGITKARELEDRGLTPVGRGLAIAAVIISSATLVLGLFSFEEIWFGF
jgi:hypothetical protein